MSKKELRDDFREYLNQQKKFLKLQEKDINENKKYRKELTNFTFVLALGVVATLILNVLWIIIELNKSKTFYNSTVLVIFMFILIIVLSIVSNKINTTKEILNIIKERPIFMRICIYIIISFFIILVVYSIIEGYYLFFKN